MFTNGSNFSGASFGNPAADNRTYFDDYLFGTPSGRPESFTRADQDGVDFDTTVAGNWWLGPSSNDDPSQYPGSTVLDAVWNGFTDPCDLQARPIPSDNILETDDVVGSDALGQWYLDVPGYQQPFMAGPPPVIQPAQHPSLPPAVLTGPMAIPSLVPTLPWGYSSTLATSSTAYSTSVNKGKGRATDLLPPVHPPPAGNEVWEYQRSYAPQQSCTGSNPHINADVSDTSLSTPVASSSGPQRSATQGVKATEKGKGVQKRAPKALPPGIDWVRTHDRFYWEMIKIYLLQPSGGLPTPEMAYAHIKKFIKEDLHQSPLVVKDLGVKPSRDLEQYLTSVLGILYPVREGEKREIQGLLDQVAGEIERGLFMVNDAVALRGGPSSRTKPGDLDGSSKRARYRRVEQGRRDASHETLGRISFFFKAPPRSLSRNEVLFFAITYIMFGTKVFGDDGFVIEFPKL